MEDKAGVWGKVEVQGVEVDKVEEVEDAVAAEVSVPAVNVYAQPAETLSNINQDSPALR